MRSLTSERETNRALDAAETADGDLWVESSSWICQRPFISSRTRVPVTGQKRGSRRSEREQRSGPAHFLEPDFWPGIPVTGASFQS